MTHAENLKDLDETRRLVYIALAAGCDPENTTVSRKADLIGTLANALAHHRSSHAPEDALELAIDIVRGRDRGQALTLIDAITEEMRALEVSEE